MAAGVLSACGASGNSASTGSVTTEESADAAVQMQMLQQRVLRRKQIPRIRQQTAAEKLWSFTILHRDIQNRLLRQLQMNLAVIPFCTSSSSGIGQSGELLEEMAGSGTWLDGERFQPNQDTDDAREWAASLEA